MFTPVNDLERRLIAAATDPDARGAFVEAALASDLYLSPASDPPVDGSIGQIVVSTLETGEQAAAVFTSPERLHEIIGPNARILALNGRRMLETLRGDPVHLNPNLVPSVIWSAADLEEILIGVRQVIAPAGAQILLAHPAEQPTALINALSAALGRVESVQGAWLVFAHRSGQVEPVWLLGVEHSGSWDVINAAIAQAVNGIDLAGRMLEATGVKNNPLGKQLRTGIPIVAPKTRGMFGFLKG